MLDGGREEIDAKGGTEFVANALPLIFKHRAFPYDMANICIWTAAVFAMV